MNDKDIKVLEELKISLSKNLERLNDSDISTTMFNIFSLRKQQAQAIENLLKENEELRKQINGAFDRGFIAVAKIKEEYERNKAKTDCRYCNNSCDSYAICMFCKKILKGK